MKYRELENGDLELENGQVIPRDKRQKMEVYSRVVGYLRQVSSWNNGKREEFKKRKVFETE